VEPLALVVLLVPNPLEALLVVSAPADGAPEELPGLVLAPRSELPVIGDLLPGAEADDALEPFWHCCCAACVFGPSMPSIAPGSQPCAFSCCCSCLIESLPALDLLEAEALEGDEASTDDLDDAAFCDVGSEDDGIGEALPEVDCAKAVPVASSAATAMASFLEVIGLFLSCRRRIGSCKRRARDGAGYRVPPPAPRPRKETTGKSFGKLLPVECAPMHSLAHLFENNRAWSQRIRRDDPEFFTRLSRQQRPSYLWIGCSDSRVPANEIVDLAPGELFVHRNVANVVVHSDLNCLSVMHFAIELLRVEHIIVCGHYGCSGVGVAMENRRIGIADNWLRHVQDVNVKHANRLAMVPEGAQRHDRLCELNVVEQVANVCATTIVQDAWERGQELTVHGWAYGLKDGLVRDLNCSASNALEATGAYQAALRDL